MAAGYDVDVASTTIRVAEGSRCRTSPVQGSVSRARDSDHDARHASGPTRPRCIGQVTQPTDDGGTAASQTRQAKEVAAQSRLGARPGPQPGQDRRGQRVGRQ